MVAAYCTGLDEAASASERRVADRALFIIVRDSLVSGGVFLGVGGFGVGGVVGEVVLAFVGVENVGLLFLRFRGISLFSGMRNVASEMEVENGLDWLVSAECEPAVDVVGPFIVEGAIVFIAIRLLFGPLCPAANDCFGIRFTALEPFHMFPATDPLIFATKIVVAELCELRKDQLLDTVSIWYFGRLICNQWLEVAALLPLTESSRGIDRPANLNVTRISFTGEHVDIAVLELADTERLADQIRDGIWRFL